jgi:glycopeptide antibiotics resistance protein
MKKLLLIFILFYSLEANNAFFKRNFWKQKDKQLHFVVATLGSIALPIIYKKVFKLNKKEIIFATIASGFLISWLKEVYDGAGHGTKDINDIDANMLGILLGTGAYIIIRW